MCLVVKEMGRWKMMDTRFDRWQPGGPVFTNIYWLGGQPTPGKNKGYVNNYVPHICPWLKQRLYLPVEVLSLYHQGRSYLPQPSHPGDQHPFKQALQTHLLCYEGIQHSQGGTADTRLHTGSTSNHTALSTRQDRIIMGVTLLPQTKTPVIPLHSDHLLALTPDGSSAPTLYLRI